MDRAEHLTLSSAIKAGRLREFVAQEESRGVGPIDRDDFFRVSAALIKAPQPENRTSRSASGDGSTGTETHQDDDPYAER